MGLGSEKGITAQLNGIKELLGPDRINYNALFLGQHDALNCQPELIEESAVKAYSGIGLDRSVLVGRYLFLFGSVDSLLQARPDVWSRLEGLPYSIYVNIGLESGHQQTLDAIRKPLGADRVMDAFDRMLEINHSQCICI